MTTFKTTKHRLAADTGATGHDFRGITKDLARLRKDPRHSRSGAWRRMTLVKVK